MQPTQFGEMNTNPTRQDLHDVCDVQVRQGELHGIQVAGIGVVLR
jgi:hypothetical protein